MRLAETQRRFARVCFAEAPQEADIEALGGLGDRWLLYRTMVRRRLIRMLESGLPRTVGNLEPALWDQLTETWLAQAPPTTRFIRDVVPAFVAHFDQRPNSQNEPAWLVDSLHYECARWTAAYDERKVEGDTTSFSFDVAPLINPTLRLLQVSHHVHRQPDNRSPEERGFPNGTALLAVYRRRNDRVAATVLSNRTFAWLDALRSSNRPTSETIQEVARKCGESIDAAYVEALGSTLAMLLENEILLGGQAPSPA